MPQTKIVNNKKKCNGCIEWLDISLFGKFKEKRKHDVVEYVNSKCKVCAGKRMSKWSKDNRDKIYASWIKSKDSMLEQIRNGYGNKCNCCGETNPLFLTIDHVNNDGYKHRGRNDGKYKIGSFSGHYYKTIIKAGFPEDLQLLCYNCNCGRARNKGICPHKI